MVTNQWLVYQNEILKEDCNKKFRFGIFWFFSKSISYWKAIEAACGLESHNFHHISKQLIIFEDILVGYWMKKEHYSSHNCLLWPNSLFL